MHKELSEIHGLVLFTDVCFVSCKVCNFITYWGKFTSSHECMDDGMRWRILGKLEAGQSQVQMATELNVTPSVICSLWKLFEDTGSVLGGPGQCC